MVARKLVMDKLVKLSLIFLMISGAFASIVNQFENFSDIYVPETGQFNASFIQIVSLVFLGITALGAAVLCALLLLARIVYILSDHNTTLKKMRDMMHDSINPFYIVRLKLPALLEQVFVWAAIVVFLFIIFSQARTYML